MYVRLGKDIYRLPYPAVRVSLMPNNKKTINKLNEFIGLGAGVWVIAWVLSIGLYDNLH